MIAFDRIENLKVGLYQEFKAHFKGAEEERTPKWENCWIFINMMYPDYAFRSAAGHYYRMATGLPDGETRWAKKGKFFWNRLCTTVEMYSQGMLKSDISVE